MGQRRSCWRVQTHWSRTIWVVPAVLGKVRKSSRVHRFGWHCALAVAVVVGAGAAYAYVASDQLNATGREARVEVRAESAHTSEASSPAAPSKPKPVLPFNAKLTSREIPTPGGGVRSGGCSGALVAPDWVVTAGHCFHDLNDVRVSGEPPYRMAVTVGKTKDSDPGGHTVEVVDVRQSPLNDLALAKLSAPITDIVPLTLADQEPALGQPMEFAGWGSTSATVVAPSDHLKRGRFTVSEIKATTLGALPVVPRTVENSPCHDDSGAPFYISSDDVTGQLVAIEVAGPECPQPGTEIIARVDVLVDWMHQQFDNGGR